MYIDKQVPTLNVLMKHIKSEQTDIVCNRSILWRKLRENGFKVKILDKRQVIVDNSMLVKLPIGYLQKIWKTSFLFRRHVIRYSRRCKQEARGLLFCNLDLKPGLQQGA